MRTWANVHHELRQQTHFCNSGDQRLEELKKVSAPRIPGVQLTGLSGFEVILRQLIQTNPPSICTRNKQTSYKTQSTSSHLYKQIQMIQAQRKLRLSKNNVLGKRSKHLQILANKISSLNVQRQHVTHIRPSSKGSIETGTSGNAAVCCFLIKSVSCKTCLNLWEAIYQAFAKSFSFAWLLIPHFWRHVWKFTRDVVNFFDPHCDIESEDLSQSLCHDLAKANDGRMAPKKTANFRRAALSSIQRPSGMVRIFKKWKQRSKKWKRSADWK